MASELTSRAGPAAARNWEELEGLLEGFSSWCAQVPGEPDFVRRLAELVLEMTGASGVTVWGGDAGGRGLQPQARLGTEAEFEQSREWRDGMTRVRVGGEPVWLEHRRGGSTTLVLLVPIVDNHTAVWILQIALESQLDTACSLEITQALAETAAIYATRIDRERCRAGLAEWRRIDEFAASVHRSLDLQGTCFTAVNDLRLLLGADRVTVLIRRPRCFAAIAASGVDMLERRSTEIRLLERLVAAAARSGEGLSYDGEEREMPVQLAVPLEAYIDYSTSRTLRLWPLRWPESREHAAWLGALVVETFGSTPSLQSDRADAAVAHVETALVNAMRWRSVPFRWLASSRWELARTTLRIALPISLIALIAACLAWIPGDLNVRADGTLQPVVRHDLFAPQDGQVHEVYVTERERVTGGMVLLVLTNDELEYEISRVQGELQTRRTALTSLEASVANVMQDKRFDRRELDRMMADQARELEIVEGLERQRDILLRQKEQLRMTGQVDGVILTSDLPARLLGRPVRRGQRLLTIADTDGPWKIELRVADRDIGYVLRAQTDTRDPLRVSYVLRTDAGPRREGRVSSVATTTEMDELGKPSVRVDVNPGAESHGFRPGAEVVAWIACGRKPLGAVWFRGVWETIRTRALFW